MRGSTGLEAAKKPCSMHERVRVDKTNGLLAGPKCGDSEVEMRVVEVYDAQLLGWAKGAGRPLSPELSSPRCPLDAPTDADCLKDAQGGTPGAGSDGKTPRCRPAGRLRVAYPVDGAEFTIDPGRRGPQAIRIRVDVPAGARDVRLMVDGRSIHLTEGALFLDWPLQVGSHRVFVEAQGMAPSEAVTFSVD